VTRTDINELNEDIVRIDRNINTLSARIDDRARLRALREVRGDIRSLVNKIDKNKDFIFEAADCNNPGPDVNPVCSRIRQPEGEEKEEQVGGRRKMRKKKYTTNINMKRKTKNKHFKGGIFERPGVGIKAGQTVRIKTENSTDDTSTWDPCWKVSTMTHRGAIVDKAGMESRVVPKLEIKKQGILSRQKCGGKRRKTRRRKRKTKRKKRKRKRKTKRKRRGGTNGSTGATKSASPSAAASTGSTGSRSETLQGMIRQGAIINHGRRVAQRLNPIGNMRQEQNRLDEAARRGIDPSRLIWANGTWIQMGGRRRKTKKKRRR
tara:strand:+ start:299 stop:1258 length:960 start_codon:yes stop_codon:yes gene_type:complete